MNEDLIGAQYDITKKTRIKKFYEDYKILIYSFLFFILFAVAIVFFYFENEKKSKVAIANDYIQATIYLENNEKNKATNILKQIINEKKGIYSVLSLFLIIDHNLLKEEEMISNLFDQVLNNNSFEEEMENLIIFKKLLFVSDFSNEADLLKSSNSIISSDSLWKGHTQLLLGDYYTSKKEYIKAKDFYIKVMNTKNLHKDLYEHARLQLSLISDE